MATNSPTRKDKSGRGRKVTKFALAGVAVLGVGAALTSAAWTDNVWFGAAASAGSVDLVGSTDRGNNWHQGNDSGASIPVDPTAFANMAPLESRVVTLSLRNNGSVPLELDDALPSGTGPLFGGTRVTMISMSTCSRSTVRSSHRTRSSSSPSRSPLRTGATTTRARPALSSSRSAHTPDPLTSRIPGGAAASQRHPGSLGFRERS